MSAYRVELQFDRGTDHVTVEATDELDANRVALKRNPSAFGARAWREPMSLEDREHYGDREEEFDGASNGSTNWER